MTRIEGFWIYWGGEHYVWAEREAAPKHKYRFEVSTDWKQIGKLWISPVDVADRDPVNDAEQPLAVDLASGQPIKVIDVSKEPKNDSGGAGAVSTAADYLRFAQMLLNGGQLDGTRILSRTTVALMTSDHLGS